jgi:hypothetical protein
MQLTLTDSERRTLLLAIGDSITKEMRVLEGLVGQRGINIDTAVSERDAYIKKLEALRRRFSFPPVKEVKHRPATVVSGRGIAL